MPKQKTHKGIAKRMKVTGTGKVKRKRSFGGHLMSTKNAKRRRRITGSTMVAGVIAKTYRGLLGE